MNATSEYAPGSTSQSSRNQSGTPSLGRPAGDRVIGGVASGIARSLGVDPVIVRIGFVVAALLGLAGVVLYVAGWLLIPDDRSGRSIAAELLEPLSARGN
jgi:phage shock protein PspC (stress-responsive transcriptional regulator)